MFEHFWPWVDYAELIKLQQRGTRYRLKKGIPTNNKQKKNLRQEQTHKNVSVPNTVKYLRRGKK